MTPAYPSRRYAFGPTVSLGVRGARPVLAHFEREYGPARPTEAPPTVAADVGFGGRPRTNEAAGGHKSARWRVALSSPQDSPPAVRIRLLGGPPSFALSLVQGYYVEPLISLALARSGFVALPSAAIITSEGALVLAGHSGSGKSSVSVRALARGQSILGDDQVIVGADGGCWAYPRRLRLYPDVRYTVPAAWDRVRPATRRALRLRAAIRRLSRGFVAPSLAVPVAELGTPVPEQSVRASRLVVVDRSHRVEAIAERERDTGWAASQAAELLRAQRARFADAAGARWAGALADAADAESAVLRGWLDRLPVTQLTLPRKWGAAEAVAALADRLETDR